MNGKLAKSLRKQLGIKKPTPLERGGLYMDKDGKFYVKNGKLVSSRASNPIMNLYRKMKRRYVRGW